MKKYMEKFTGNYIESVYRESMHLSNEMLTFLHKEKYAEKYMEQYVEKYMEQFMETQFEKQALFSRNITTVTEMSISLFVTARFLRQC